MRFKEDTLGQVLSQDLGDDVEKVVKQSAAGMDNVDIETYEGDIEKALTRAFNTNKRLIRRGSHTFESVLLIGEAGTGKTSRVKAWAEKNGYNLYARDVKTMDMSDLGGLYVPDHEKKQAVSYSNGSFNPLERENSVLFLDEYNRANAQLRGVMLGLVNNHEIPDSNEPNGAHYFKNLVLVIAAINPQDETSGSAYNTDMMDAAELARFRNVHVKNDKLITLRYLMDMLAKDYEDATPEEKFEDKRRAALADKLLRDGRFEFDSPEEVAECTAQQRPSLNPRTFEYLIQDCDGTKADFLDAWDDYCNQDKKPMAAAILRDYEDLKPEGEESEADEMAELEQEFGGEDSPFAAKNDIFSALINAARDQGAQI